MNGEPPHAARASVLVVDDQEVNLKLMRTYLRTEAYDVVTCADPQQALKLVEESPPDLILLDLMMPVLNGFEMLELLRDIAPEVPVIVVTGIDDRDARLRGLAAGARDFLTKPVDRSELLIRVRNLTDLKRAGDALARAVAQLESANRDLDAFAGGLAHDLQQPITSIAAFAQIIQRASGHQLSPDNATHLTRILAAAGSADRMIRGLLEFARLGQKTIETVPVNLNEVVQEARNALGAQSAGRTISWSVAALPTVRGDPSLLLLAFVNLLSNAIKYSRKTAQAAITIEAETDVGSGHTVRVRDNGVGFDMAHAGHLFNPFERLHSASEFEGTGMGLANVRRIMERHGGSIAAESSPGQGATFTLHFRA
ncbi:MAG TPA: response regulator [Ramlibacter sp.]|uniref:sensor histidine kinase n=1 Tax=Ramlibacter sp. TaxID=1917967 RepID=UPI002BC48111|nr:response regulator [Ramlibacter sp.]HVZ44076.1 response regulator [Ramlibacter sp.]